MNLLSLNSHVAYGYVGNAAAVFALQRLGLEVWPLHTVRLSNHPGHGGFTGGATSPAALDELVAGVIARDIPAACGGVVSGYLGAAEQASTVLRAVAAVRGARDDAIYVLDPVMGDAGPGLYVDPAIAGAMRDDLLPVADVVTPNAFELGWLTGRAVTDTQSGLDAARAVIARGPRLVAVTSLPVDAVTLGVLGVTADAAWLIRVPRLAFPVPPNGAGDLLTALIAGRLVRGDGLPGALAAATNAVNAVLLATREAGRRELALVAAQDALAAPPDTLRAAAL